MTSPDRESAANEAAVPLTASDFDGHRSFASWTPEQRLDWLGQVVAFVAELRGAAARGTSLDPAVRQTRGHP